MLQGCETANLHNLAFFSKITNTKSNPYFYISFDHTPDHLSFEISDLYILVGFTGTYFKMQTESRLHPCGLAWGTLYKGQWGDHRGTLYKAGIQRQQITHGMPKLCRKEMQKNAKIFKKT